MGWQWNQHKIIEITLLELKGDTLLQILLWPLMAVRRVAKRHCWPWWRHQMETFSASLAICAGNSPVTGEFPAQRPVTRSLGVFFDLRLNKRLSKQWWGWWFETPSSPLCRHCNVLLYYHINVHTISLNTWKYIRSKNVINSYTKHKIFLT